MLGEKTLSPILTRALDSSRAHFDQNPARRVAVKPEGFVSTTLQDRRDRCNEACFCEARVALRYLLRGREQKSNMEKRGICIFMHVFVVHENESEAVFAQHH